MHKLYSEIILFLVVKSVFDSGKFHKPNIGLTKNLREEYVNVKPRPWYIYSLYLTLLQCPHSLSTCSFVLGKLTHNLSIFLVVIYSTLPEFSFSLSLSLSPIVSSEEVV